MDKEMSPRKRTVILISVVIVMAVTLLLPTPAGLAREGQNAIGLMICCVILWITNALPMGVTAVLGMISMPYLGIMDFGSLWPSFSSQVLFFVIASFGISAGLLKTHLPKRIIGFVLKVSHGRSAMVVLGFGLATGLVSSVISDIPSVVMFAEIAVTLLGYIGVTRDRPSNFGRALMIAIPSGALLGGIATPSGNSLNLLLMTGMEELGGPHVTYIGWAFCAAPFALIALVLACMILNLVFKPEDIPEEAVDKLQREIRELGSLDSTEIKYLAVLALIILMWILSSWYSFLNIAVVSIVGVVILGLPGIDVLPGQEWINGVNWDVVLRVGCIISMGVGVQSTGAITWLLGGIEEHTAGMPYLAVLLILALIPCILHMFMPLAGAMYALAFVPLMMLGDAMGVSMTAGMFIFAIWMNNEYLFPTDAIILLSYGHGLFSAKDLMKAGSLITLMLLAMSVIAAPVFSRLMVLI